MSTWWNKQSQEPNRFQGQQSHEWPRQLQDQQSHEWPRQLQDQQSHDWPRQLQDQQQVTLSAYDRKTIHDMLFMTMEWLEKCIEIAGYYPDWRQRKQIHNTNIKRQDIDCLGKAEKGLSNKLVVFVRSIGGTVPPFLNEELKEQFYKWIYATGINAENCPKRLAFFLLGVHEILEGKDAKIEQDSDNKKRSLDSESYEYGRELNRVFAHIQAPLQEERNTAFSLEGKKWNNINIENHFEGDAYRGKATFERIVKNISAYEYQNFHFFPQKSSNSMHMDLI
ncbi:19563_t:CDS:1 [Dentiscutata erythropus]|uniref:19563_t:CDS:1 n=1 Tax=Dentiscutata erythropus TaxID=1348616 RepID=A0A9N9J2F4_9GLOM|nr:19563_t:CDS:1 [Dentiscutata erythropus]